MTETEIITLDKLEAARRQLATAIELWFCGGDPVSAHTLAHAAYEIIHTVAKRRNSNAELLFDALMIKDEFRTQWAVWLKEPGNWFKHARDDPDGTLEFKPILTELFLLFAVRGVDFCKVARTPEEQTFWLWLYYHRSDMLSEEGRKLFIDGPGVQHVEAMRSMDKPEFFQISRKVFERPDAVLPRMDQNH